MYTMEGPEATRGQPLVRLARLLEGVRVADLQTPSPSALEHAERVAGHAQLPAHERHQRVEHALLQRLLRRGGRDRLHDARLAVGSVALADDRVLAGQDPVVVERGFVEEGAVR